MGGSPWRPRAGRWGSAPRDRDSHPVADVDARGFEIRVLVAARWVALFVVAVSISYGMAVGDDAEAVWITGAAVVIAAAAGGVGTLLGFLFGIPRTLQQETAAGEDGPRYLANTNLEQISDWLTKILVGISLVQIGDAGPALGRLAEALGPMLGDDPASPGFGLAICIVASLSGFLLAYLWTRVRLKRELQIADQDAEAAARQVMDKQASADARALSVVDRQLTPGRPHTRQELVSALRMASQPVRLQAFQRAEEQRSRSWNDPSIPEDHERTIPVFEALIEIDRTQLFHRFFGSLGFTLKDRPAPDLDGAIEALTKAITIRGDASKAGFTLYEWNRAACRILLLHTSASDETPELRTEIEADLRIAARRLSRTLFMPSADPTVRAVVSWMEAHDLTYDALHAAPTETDLTPID